MTLSQNTNEIDRLIDAFEVEAGKFHNIDFSVYYVTQDGPNTHRKLKSPNHAIMLWQYYGRLNGNNGVDQFVGDLSDSNLKWGIRGAELTQFGLIEGQACKLFVRMGQRAGSIFTDEQSQLFHNRVVDEITSKESEKDPKCKPTSVMNNNPLAIWLNYLLFHLSLTNPGREKKTKIDPDPFTLSLLALERLAAEQNIGKSDRSISDVTNLQFSVAVSFPGEKRRYVSHVVDELRPKLGPDAVFYDFDYQAQLARPNADTLLQNIYRNQSSLIVVFLCAEYSEKLWCGLEWRAIRDIIKFKDDHRIMFVRFDDAPIDGTFSIDGYIDASKFTSKQVAEFILQRIALQNSV